MSKKVKIVILSVTAALVILFVTILLLALPIRTTGTLPMIVAYVTGYVVAGIFLVGAIFFALLRLRRLTRGGVKYYHNGKYSDEEGEGTRK